MAKIELLPCPFCGAEAQFRRFGPCDENVLIECANPYGACCSMTMPYTSKAEELLANKWNHRTKPISDELRKAMINYIGGVPILRYLTELNDENLAKEVMESNTVQNALLELLDIKTRINHEIVYCNKCRYLDFSKTVDYLYVCKNIKSPCRNRLVSADFGCAYGQKKEVKPDA